MAERAIVTGGAGFIGSHVVDSLLRDGYEVLVVDDLSAGDADRVAPARASPARHHRRSGARRGLRRVPARLRSSTWPPRPA